MKQPAFGFALQYVTDIEAATRFYVEVMGLKVERQHAKYVQFEHFAIASDESLSNSKEEIYWLVEDAEAAIRELGPKVEISQPLKEMPFGKVFGVKDPAGRPRFLLEFAKHRPSQAV